MSLTQIMILCQRNDKCKCTVILRLNPISIETCFFFADMTENGNDPTAHECITTYVPVQRRSKNFDVLFEINDWQPVVRMTTLMAGRFENFRHAESIYKMLFEPLLFSF